MNRNKNQRSDRTWASLPFAVLFAVFLLLGLAGPACQNNGVSESSRVEGNTTPGLAEVTVVVDGAIGPPSTFGLNQLLQSFQTSGITVNQTGSFEQADTHKVILLGTQMNSALIQDWIRSGSLELSGKKESLAVKKMAQDGKDILVLAGADERGLMYALLEIAQQVESLEDTAEWFTSLKEAAESPAVPVRSMAVLLHNEDCEKEWYYSKEYWQDYFGMLAADRWNTFNLIFSHQTPYLSPLYAFHVKIKEHPEVRAIGLSEEQREKNLKMLQTISSLAAERGIDFTLGIWQQIAWEGENQGSRQESMVRGLTRKNMHSYTYLALKTLLEQCPEIKTVQLRINHESGIDYGEQTEFYRDAVFKAIQDCARPVLLESRNVGLLVETIQASVDMGLPIRVSHKYWGEHMVFPYHPTRLMWTYSYGDWLKYPQLYANIFQVWSLGSHRLLLWGDPEYVRRFAPTTTFQNSSGFEICAPLSQKGYGNAPGAWRIFRHREREFYRWEYERYWSTYRLFGRLSYNPDAGDDIWMRELRQRFGRKAAPSIAKAYRSASRILPYILGSATFDYNMGSWAEKDMGGLINFFIHFISYNESRISGFEEFTSRTLEGIYSAKLTPPDIADRLERLADDCEQALNEAEGKIGGPNKEFWATQHDFLILSGMARYFSRKLRAAVNLSFYYALGDLSLLKKAVTQAEEGLRIWKGLSAVAEEIYSPNLVMGTGSHGHWTDNTSFVENDLKQLRDQEALFHLLGNFDYGFDFGPPSYSDNTTTFTPRYTNDYHVEHRFKGVSPESFYLTGIGYGWQGNPKLFSEQPKQIHRSTWRAVDFTKRDIPSNALLGDFVQGKDEAVFYIDLPEGHYQATLVMTDQTSAPADHGPMSVSVIERFGERRIITDRVIRKGETVVEKFNFNMVGSRYSNFRLKLRAAPGADFILNALTFTRIEPHIAHLPVRRSSPGREIEFTATVTLPDRVVLPEKNSLSIARGTTSNIEAPASVREVKLFFSANDGKTYSVLDMTSAGDAVYSVTVPGSQVKRGVIRYFIEAVDSIGQSIHLPARSNGGGYFSIGVSEDMEGPEIKHTPVMEGRPGQPVKIGVNVTDTSAIEEVRLYYRPTRQAMEYSVLTMYPEGQGSYSATIPGDIFTEEYDLLYYIEAVDEHGNGRFFPDPDTSDPQLVINLER